MLCYVPVEYQFVGFQSVCVYNTHLCIYVYCNKNKLCRYLAFVMHFIIVVYPTTDQQTTSYDIDNNKSKKK